MTNHAAEVAAPRSLSRLLQLGSTWTLDQSLQLVRRLAVEVQSLHRSGRTHRALGAEAVIVEEGHPPRLSSCPAQRSFGGDDSDPEFCPAELADGDSLELPESIEAAAAVLQARGVSLDPRQIDIYQLGTLLCRLLSGQTMASYMYTARGKAQVPAAARSLLERMLGHDATHRFGDLSEVLMALDDVRGQLGAAPEAPAMSDTPPRGSAIGPIGSTPRHGHAAVALRDAAPGETEDLPFHQLGHYRILACVGRGGMGDVYQGYDDSLHREVAIKVLPAELARNADFVRRFHAEAAAAAQIAHPNVVPIFFIGEDAGHHFFAMQYVRGESLAARLALRRRLPLDEVQRILAQCLAGLGAAHARGMIHRDIKPGNILLESESDRAMLVDFGLVRRVDEAAHMTATGIVMGTVDYIAPEQARGQPVDGRADLYSLGVLAYQLLSGRLPFVADTPTAMIFQHAYEKPLPLDEAAPDVPQPMVRIVARLMAKNPAERYQNTGEVLADLAAASEGRELPCAQEAAAKPLAAAPAAPSDADLEREEWSPSALPQMRPYGRWQRACDFAATVFRRHAPEFIQQLQSTTQQVDGAVAHYQRQRDRLARLAEEGQRVLESLPAGPEREEHRERLEDLKSQLAKADATLAQLHSQRDLLQARLRAVGASNDMGLEKVAQRRRRRRRFALAGMLLALIAAAFIVPALRRGIPLPGLPQGPAIVVLPQEPTVSPDAARPILPATTRPVSTKASAAAIRADSAKYFARVDTNGDGVLDFREWWQSEYKGLPEETMRRMFKIADRNGDGKVDMQEYQDRTVEFHFCRMDTNYDDRLSRKEHADGDKGTFYHKDMNRIFNAYDVNGDGWLSLAEFTDRSPGGQYPETSFFLNDLNGDGRLSVEEFTFRTEPKDLASYTAQFAQKDKNHDGYLSLREYLYAPTDWHFWPYDFDGDGYVSEAEYRKATAQAAASRGQQGTKWGVTPFSSMDLNHDGKLSIAEYHAAFNLSQKGLAHFTAHNRDVRFVGWTHDGRTLITGGLDNFVKRWDMTNGKCIGDIAVPNAVSSGAVSHNGQILAVGQYVNNAIHLWDIQRQKPLGELLGHTQDSFVLAFSPDDKILVSGGYDKTVRVWDLESKKRLRALPTQTLPITGLAISPDGKTLATTTGDWRIRGSRGELRLWNMASGQQLTTLPPTGSRFDVVAFSPDGATLAYGGADWSVYLCDVKKLHDRRLLRPSTGPTALQFLAQGRLLASGEEEGGVAVWDVAVPDETRIRFHGHKAHVHSIALSPDGSVLASASKDGTVGLWPMPREAWTQSTSGEAKSTSADLVRKWPAQGAEEALPPVSGDATTISAKKNVPPLPARGDISPAAEESRFQHYDTDADGFLDFQEFWQGQYQERSEQYAKRLFGLLDRRGDGKIDMQQYVRRGDAKYYFYQIDTDCDGRLSRKEAAAGERQTGHHQDMDSVFNALDMNGDGWLSLEEFTDRGPTSLFCEAEFFYRDLNGDVRLTIEEFMCRVSQAYRASATETFTKKDTNHDGYLSLRECLYDPTDKPFWDQDLDEDGYVSEAEYLQSLGLAAPSSDPVKRSSALKTFASMDQNHDGKLSVREHRESASKGTK